MKKRKTIIAAVVLLLVFVVGGAIAYFTDTDSATNTFTIGNVAITLSEPDWVTTDSNSNGVPDAAENVMPGQEIPKDPTIAVDTGSNPALLFAKVEVPCVGTTEIFDYDKGEYWVAIQETACTSGVATKIYALVSNPTAEATAQRMTAVSAGSDSTLFTKAIVNNLTNADVTALQGQNLDLKVYAYGIQAEGFEDKTPSQVWTAANFA